MKTTLRCLAVLAALVAAAHPSELFAQFDNEWVGPATSTNSWTNGANWSATVPPDPEFDQNAKLGAVTDVVGVSNTIEVTLTTDLSGTPSPQVILGDATGFQGTLNLESGAVFATAKGFVANFSYSDNFDVGINGGTGFLNVSGTGRLNVAGQLATTTSGNAASTITLRDSADVTAGKLFLEHNLRIIGPDVRFAVTGNAILGGPGIHEWEYALTGPSAGPSVLSVAGELSLDGTLKIDTLGETPAVGNSWVIADSQSVIQGFTSIDTSDVAGLGQGVALRVTSTADAGSTHGVLTRVVVEQQPVLVVNRRSGEVAIRNPGATATVAFDAYELLSSAGSLSQAVWTSIAPAGGWQEANPNSQALSELNALSSQSLAAGTTIPLGAVFQPADQPFGQDTEDVSFRFAPGDGDFVDGLVVYEGIPTDTLTLNIDRTTGSAQILNGFRDAVSIDTYAITSASGSLNPSPGGWSPIGGGWQVAENEVGAVSELNPLSMLDLPASVGQALGSLYDFDAAGAQEDLVFEFSLPNEDFFRAGKVVFADALTVLPQGLPGDYNNDGMVSAADYTVWRDNLGQSDSALNGNGTGDASGLVVQADYTYWKFYLGATSGSASATAASAVPEPAGLALAGLLLTLWTGRRNRG